MNDTATVNGEIWPWQTLCHQGPQTYGVLECIVDSFGLDYFLLTEGIILDPVTRSGSNYPNHYKGNQLPITEPTGGTNYLCYHYTPTHNF
jgi:hypothetical protein